MTEERRLYRSREALAGGVCAGVADYFYVDPLAVRILAVVLAIASAGVLGIAYLALWAVLPKAPKAAGPLDVEPQSVSSDTYGAVDCDRARASAAAGKTRSTAASAAGQRYVPPSYGGTTHIPPEPPAAAPYQRPMPQQPSPPPPATPPRETSDRWVAVALWVGSILLFLGFASLAATFVSGVFWWQYWPLILVIVGIVRMVLPGREGHRMGALVQGLVCFFTGSTLLMMSLGIVSWKSLPLMFESLWPLLLMMAGFGVLGSSLKSPVMTLLAGVCFAAFCVCGLLWFSVPGSMTEVVLVTPYGREYRFDVVLDDLSLAASGVWRHGLVLDPLW